MHLKITHIAWQIWLSVNGPGQEKLSEKQGDFFLISYHYLFKFDILQVMQIKDFFIYVKPSHISNYNHNSMA